MNNGKDKRGSMWKDLKVPGPKQVLTHGTAVLLASALAALAVAAMDSAFAAVAGLFL